MTLKSFEDEKCGCVGELTRPHANAYADVVCSLSCAQSKLLCIYIIWNPQVKSLYGLAGPSLPSGIEGSMTRVRICLVCTLLVSSLVSTLGNTRDRRSTSTTKSRKLGVADSVSHRAGPGFVKTLFKKPPLPDALGGTTNVSTTRDSVVYVCATGGKSKDTLPRLSSSTYGDRRLSCSLELYRVMLSYRDCSRPVLTQV